MLRGNVLDQRIYGTAAGRVVRVEVGAEGDFGGQVGI